MTHSRRSSAFTLIELLIVVLIIAILAAIAVPNFLEFQTRAKVARVQSDMRAISVAVEAYRVDNNAYPPNLKGTPRANIMDMSMMMSDAWMPFVPFTVTTPIAYLSNLPLDTFKPRVMLGHPAHPHFHTFMYFNSTNTPSLDALRNYRSLVESRAAIDGTPEARWAMISTGPDQEMGAMAMEMDLRDNHLPIYSIMAGGMMMGSPRQYDPTNGTVSAGDIVRFGP